MPTRMLDSMLEISGLPWEMYLEKALEGAAGGTEEANLLSFKNRAQVKSCFKR